ncbi:MAG: hypothetical protein HZY75_08480 [Nocardioidaceae bacterium]|nr:MAG: hypothetical protein HZY75_08480 [Nocardioidaceae bacterium]
MGVSAVGNRGIRPATIPWLVGGSLALLITLIWVFAPPLVPGLRSAAHEQCNELTGANYRNYRIAWVTPRNLNFDFPHWSCTDLRTAERPTKSLGWWVNPF